MDLKDCKLCNKCKTIYSVGTYANMSADGEKTYSEVSLYGRKFDLCPKCTKEVFDLITKGGS